MRDCCSSGTELRRKGPWTAEEDELLANYIRTHGEGPWKCLPHRAGLLRCGKSCRLRWLNYLRPDIRRGNITPDEEDIIIRMHMLLGNRWSLIAGRLPGRTDNEIKNYWNTHLCKKMKFKGTLLPLGSTHQLQYFRHGENDKGDIHDTHVDGEGHVYDNEPKYKKCRSVESTESVKIYTPKPIRISTTNCSSRVEVWTPKPIRVTASCLSKTPMYASNVTSAMGNDEDNSCNGRGENCKLIEEVHKFFDNEDDLQEQNHCYEICTDHRLGIADGRWKVSHQGNAENLVNDEPKTLEMVYQEYLQLLHRQD